MRGALVVCVIAGTACSEPMTLADGGDAAARDATGSDVAVDAGDGCAEAATVEDLLRHQAEYARAWCALAERCGEARVVWPDLDACARFEWAYVVAWLLRDVAGEVERGLRAYDPAAAAACFAEMAECASTAEQALGARPNACSRVFPPRCGRVQPDERCLYDADCDEGGYCGLGCPHRRCRPLIPPGEPCTHHHGECAPAAGGGPYPYCGGTELTCRSAEITAERAGLGEPCLRVGIADDVVILADCEEGLTCQVYDDGSYRCAAQGSADVGERCEVEPDCRAELYCDRLEGVCREPQRGVVVEVGTPCADGDACELQLGTSCVDGTCMRAGGIDEPCDDAADLYFACDPPLACDPATRTCRPRRAVGASCTGDYDCASWCCDYVDSTERACRAAEHCEQIDAERCEGG